MKLDSLERELLIAAVAATRLARALQIGHAELRRERESASMGDTEKCDGVDQVELKLDGDRQVPVISRESSGSEVF